LEAERGAISLKNKIIHRINEIILWKNNKKKEEFNIIWDKLCGIEKKSRPMSESTEQNLNKKVFGLKKLKKLKSPKFNDRLIRAKFRIGGKFLIKDFNFKNDEKGKEIGNL
jgi:hypothetical protein